MSQKVVKEKISSSFKRVSNSFRRASSGFFKPSGYEGMNKLSKDQDGSDKYELESHEILQKKSKTSKIQIILKHFLYFAISFAISTSIIIAIIYSQNVFTFEINGAISGSIGLITATGFAFNKPIRCILTLSLPQLTSGQGRIVILAITTGLLIGGPFENIIFNANEASNSINCTRNLMTNRTMEEMSKMTNESQNFRESRQEKKKILKESRFDVNVSLKNVRIRNSTLKIHFTTLIKDLYRDFKPILAYTNMIIKYLFFLTIILIPYGTWKYLKRYKTQGKVLKKEKIHLVVNLAILGFHILLSIFVIGFDWMLFWIQNSANEWNKVQNNGKNETDMVSIEGDLISIFEFKDYNFKESRNHSFIRVFNISSRDFSKCLPSPREPGGYDQLFIFAGLYFVVFIFIFVGKYSPTMKLNIVRKFYPIEQNSHSSITDKEMIKK